MTNDERFERDLAAVVREGVPTMTPSSLRQRLEASLAASNPSGSRRRFAPALGAAAAVAVLIAAAIVGPKLLEAPGQTPRASNPTTGLRSAKPAPGASTRVPTGTPDTAPLETTPPSTAAPLPEPITHAGFIQTGELLTPADGWVVTMGGRLLITHSAGEAWRDVTPPGVEGELLRPTFVDPSHGWLVAVRDVPTTDLKIWRTTDAGVTWTTSILKGLGNGNGAPVFLTATLGWLATDAGGDHPKPELRWTADGGSTWSDPIDLTPSGRIATYEPITFIDGQVGFLSGEDFFRRTTDGGRTWTEIDLEPPTRPVGPDEHISRIGTPTFGDATHGVIQVGLRFKEDGTPAGGAVYSTSDGGATWQLSLNDDQRRAWMFIDELHWVALDGEHVWSTSDAGQTISVAPSSGLPAPLGRAYGTFVDPFHAWVSAAWACPTGNYCAISFNNFFGTSDGGRTWSNVGD